MSQKYTDDFARSYLSDLGKLGYSDKEIMDAYIANKGNEIKRGLPEENAIISAINDTLKQLGSHGKPQELKFVCLGTTATTRMKAKPVARVSIFASIIDEKALQPPYPYFDFSLFGDDTNYAKDLLSQNAYSAIIQKNANGGWNFNSIPKQFSNLQMDMETYLKTFGIQKITIAQARTYRPELNAAGYPIKAQLFAIEGWTTKPNAYTPKEETKYIGYIFNLIDNSEILPIGKDPKGYPLKGGIPVYASPTHINIIGEKTNYIVIGTISNKENNTTMNAIAVYSVQTIEQTVGFEER